jgi:hypothetical protein
MLGERPSHSPRLVGTLPPVVDTLLEVGQLRHRSDGQKNSLS